MGLVGVRDKSRKDILDEFPTEEFICVMEATLEACDSRATAKQFFHSYVQICSETPPCSVVGPPRGRVPVNAGSVGASCFASNAGSGAAEWGNRSGSFAGVATCAADAVSGASGGSCGCPGELFEGGADAGECVVQAMADAYCVCTEVWGDGGSACVGNGVCTKCRAEGGEFLGFRVAG